MSDQGSHRDAQDRRPLPSGDQVIGQREVPDAAGTDAPAAKTQPKIESSLLGTGDLPAAERRGDAKAARPGAETVRPAEGKPFKAAPHQPDAKTVAPPVTAAAPVTVRRGGFWPMAFGGAVAAALGAGAAWWAIPHLPADWRPVTSSAVPAEAPSLTPQIEAAARSAATEAARDEVAALTQTLTAEARRAATEATEAALAAAPEPQVAAASEAAALEQQAQRIAALEEAAKAPAASLDTSALESRIAALEARGPVVGAQTPNLAVVDGEQDRLAQLQATLADQAKRIEELAARPVIEPAEAEALSAWRNDAEATRKAISEAATGAEQRLKDMQAQTDALAAKVDDTARKAESAAAIAALEGVLLSGGDGKGAAAQLQSAGVQPPQPLTVPVPALTALQRDFPDAARAGLRAALRAEAPQQGTGTGLANFLRAQTGARSVTPRAGTDPDAILSRAGAAVEKGEISAALTEIAALPAPAQAEMTGWIEPAKAWVAAREALNTLKTTP